MAKRSPRSPEAIKDYILYDFLKKHTEIVERFDDVYVIDIEGQYFIRLACKGRFYIWNCSRDRIESLRLREGYDWIAAGNGSLAPVKFDGKWGFIGLSTGNIITCQEVIPCKYDEVGSFNEGLSRVKLDGKYGFVDKSGKQIVACVYDYVGDFHDGLVHAHHYNLGSGEFWNSYFDKYGELQIQLCRYAGMDDFFEGLAAVKINVKCAFKDDCGLPAVKFIDKWGFIDKTGNEVIPCKFNRVYRFSEGLARVKLNRKYGFINKSGKEIIPLKYDDATDFNDGLAGVKLYGKWGFIDKTGKEIIPLKYDDATDFNDGLAGVKLYGKWGFIDKTGKEIIPLRYGYIGEFRNGLALAQCGWKYGFINLCGREVIPLRYDEACEFSEGLAAVKETFPRYLRNEEGADFWGFIDERGEEVIPLNINAYYAGPFRDGLAAVGEFRSRHYYYINRNGVKVKEVKVK